MVTVPKKVIARLIKEVSAFQSILTAAKDRDDNESDTADIVKDILDRVFGYDKYTEVTSEYAIKKTYCDLAVKLDGTVKYLIEVKAIGLALKENHLRQAVNYGANHGVDWVILTNGIDWEVYRIKFERPIKHDLVCAFSFLELNPRSKEDQDLLFLLCKKGVTKAALEEFHQHLQHVNRFVIGAILQTEPVINVIQRELKRAASGVKVTDDEIKDILLSGVMKREVVEGEAADQARHRVKKASGKTLRKRRAVKKVAGASN